MSRLLRFGDHADGTYRAGIILGLSGGIITILAGMTLCILGLGGWVQLVVEGPGLAAKLKNASPGVVFAVLGMIIAWRFKPKVTVNVRTENKTLSRPGGYSSSSSITIETRTSGSRLSSDR